MEAIVLIVVVNVKKINKYLYREIFLKVPILYIYLGAFCIVISSCIYILRSLPLFSSMSLSNNYSHMAIFYSSMLTRMSFDILQFLYAYWWYFWRYYVVIIIKYEVESLEIASINDNAGKPISP